MKVGAEGGGAGSREPRTVVVDGRTLTPSQVEAVARAGAPVALAAEAALSVKASRAALERMLDREEPIYGVSTGFGRLANVRIPRERQRILQVNLVRSHAAGTGTPLPTAQVRAMLLLRANALARGESGCRLVVVERILDLLNNRIHPVIPEVGSVGASGDLAPLAHMALALIGEGSVETTERTEAGDRIEPSRAAMRAAGLEPLDLVEKEGLALVNGTQATTGIGILAVARFGRALDTADVAGAMSLEGLRGTPSPFRSRIHAARPHPGQITSARRLRALLVDSEIRESHRAGDARVQDAYSLRCMPQVHGAAREAYDYAERILATEANSTTDNPLVFAEEGEVVSGGNFHAQIVAQCLDLVAIAAADLASISERRIERLLNPDLSGLPAFLAYDPGICSGMMVAQIAAADALSEMRVLAAPASVDSVSTSAAQEDHVSMGMAAARKIRRSVHLLEVVLAAEVLCATQAIEFQRPLKAGRGVERAFARIRGRIGPYRDDRPLSEDLDAVIEIVAAGELASDALLEPSGQGDGHED